MATQKKYFISQFLQEKYQHGGVGCVDAEQILLAKGFEPISFPHYESFSPGAKVSRFFFLLKTFLKIASGSVVVFLFPVHARMNRLLVNLLRRKKIQLVCFIADINGIKDGDEKVLNEEVTFFKKFNYFIVHNQKMEQWVGDKVGVESRIFSIEFFDFLAQPLAKRQALSFDIVFAGNLGKSIFLEKLHLLNKEQPNLRFHLYGPGHTDAMLAQPNVTWHGIESPYDLPAKLNGSFGLLWDGDSIDGPGGSLGNYMQFISHHKLSLYILSKLPIIVPATAASASLIEKYNIGFAINNLYEVEEKIKRLSNEDYHQMQTNMNPLADAISRGGCLEKAINELMKYEETR